MQKDTPFVCEGHYYDKINTFKLSLWLKKWSRGKGPHIDFESGVTRKLPFLLDLEYISRMQKISFSEAVGGHGPRTLLRGPWKQESS